MTSIEALAQFLGIEARQTAKAVFFMATRTASGETFPVFAVVRGDLEVNEVKLANALGGAELRPMVDTEVAAYGITAGLIFCLAREFDFGLNEILARKAERYAGRGVVGIDLAGPGVDAPREVDRVREAVAA